MKRYCLFQNANVSARTSGRIDSSLPGLGTQNVRTFNHLTISAGVTLEAVESWCDYNLDGNSSLPVFVKNSGLAKVFFKTNLEVNLSN